MQRAFVTQGLHKLKELSGLEGRWKDSKNQIDGILEIYEEGRQPKQFPVILKSTIVRTHLMELHKALQKNGQLMVIAGKISPNIREQLREWKMGYLDSAGNVYVNTGDYFVFIEGQKNYPNTAKQKRRLFTKTGIRVVFHLLAAPEVQKLTYRELSEALDVSLGSITNAMQQLKDQGFLLKTGSSGWRLHDREKLLKKWIDAYVERLKPDLLAGRFRFASREQNWEKAELPPDTFWGGEPAACLITGYLRPAEWALYSSQDIPTLMKSLRLLPDDNGNVWVYQKFWSDALIHEQKNTAPDLLIYTDLIASGEERNLETAQKLYDEFIKAQL
ncbi:MAG: hypothetical protein H6573_31885 [Lewinellaceae bacterium]|nr:hypothetical protein [Lewinellaceae bacterium]